MNDESVEYVVEQAFGSGGLIAKHKPDYVKREGQIALATEIGNTLEDGAILLAEGATGVGKSVAYLIPSIHYAIKSKSNVLVVTANKALQDQLIEKDLPLLQTALADTLPFTFSSLKGRSNYLCQREMTMYEDKTRTSVGTTMMPSMIGQTSGPMLWPDENLATEGEALIAWGSALPAPSGERSDAPSGISDKAWRLLSVSAENCDRGNCPHYETCFAEKAGDKARTCNIVVVNYDLLFSKLMHSKDPLWKQFKVAVLDECHEAAGIARRCFTVEISDASFRALARTLTDRIGKHDLAKAIRDAIGPFFERMSDYAQGVRGARIEDPNFIDISNITEVLQDVLDNVKARCGGCIEGELCGNCNDRMRVRSRAEELSTHLTEFVAQSNDQVAYWLDKGADHGKVSGLTVKLCAAPYDVREHLREMVFNKFESVICTSATMTSGGTFDFIRGELGLDTVALNARVETIRVASPFDYAKQAKFVIPLGIPFPTKENEAAFDDATVKALKQLIHECKGRLLALFTSRKRLNYVADRLTDQINYPLLVQGKDGQNKLLAQMFRDQTDSVLLATKSFWTGLDISGEALSCLVIDKLPFESFDDPFVDMWKKKKPDRFFDSYYVPRAAITLAQGAGRLIRSVDDVGVFVLLDQRIKAYKYGRAFLASLPFKGYSEDISAAGKFLDGK